MLPHCVGRGVNMTRTPKKENDDEERAQVHHALLTLHRLELNLFWVPLPTQSQIQAGWQVTKLCLMKQEWAHVPLVYRHRFAFNKPVDESNPKHRSCSSGSKSRGTFQHQITCMQLPSVALAFGMKQSWNTVGVTDRMLGICPLWELSRLARIDDSQRG